jgi:hypothetical protein
MFISFSWRDKKSIHPESRYFGSAEIDLLFLKNKIKMSRLLIYRI